jgi:hypothetical protein
MVNSLGLSPAGNRAFSGLYFFANLCRICFFLYNILKINRLKIIVPPYRHICMLRKPDVGNQAGIRSG